MFQSNGFQSNGFQTVFPKLVVDNGAGHGRKKKQSSERLKFYRDIGEEIARRNEREKPVNKKSVIESEKVVIPFTPRVTLAQIPEVKEELRKISFAEEKDMLLQREMEDALALILLMS